MLKRKEFRVGDRVETDVPGSEEYDQGVVVKVLSNGLVRVGWELANEIYDVDSSTLNLIERVV